jgi:CheY-like chemotaxis protein
MSQKHILFVEDEEGDRYSLSKAVEAWNKANEDRQFEVHYAGTVPEAFESLDFHRFDGALFDLKLPSPDPAAPTGGNVLAQAGLSAYGIPVGIISGHPQDVDPELRDIVMLRVFNKLEEQAYADAVAWLGGEWGMMDTLASSRAEIRRAGANIFPNFVWPHWRNYEGLKGASKPLLTRIVARQYASHIAELLGANVEGDEGWHPFEQYIQPAMLADRIQTGDLFRLNEELWVVLTPACDLATGKAAVILLAHCRSGVLRDWPQRVAELSDGTLNRKDRDARDAYFNKLVNQAEPGKHFLPPLLGGEPMFVDFKDIRTLAIADLVLTDRVASIAPPFLPNLVQRFGAYLTRTGQPDIDIRHFG